jgi:phenylacetate-CoA ligase
VDNDGNPVPYGQPGDRLLLTNLFNLDQPLIRYDMSDAVTITDDPCPCGCAHRRITSIHGRINGAFEYENGARVPRADLERTIVTTPGVSNFFVGKAPGGADVSVVTDGSCDRQQLQRDLTDVLRRHGAPESDVVVREVDSIERLSRGKCRQFDAR